MEDSKPLKRYRPKSSDNNEDKKQDRSQKKRKHKKSKKKDRKRERRYSSSSDEPGDKLALKMRTKHKRKCKKRREHTEYHEKSKTKTVIETKQAEAEVEEPLIGPEVPAELLQKAQSMAPMSKEEWEKKQNTVRRVFDEATSRTRLVKGEGEIVEEIVSRERHMEINRQATLGDGNFFQSNVKKTV